MGAGLPQTEKADGESLGPRRTIAGFGPASSRGRKGQCSLSHARHLPAMGIRPEHIKGRRLMRRSSCVDSWISLGEAERRMAVPGGRDGERGQRLRAAAERALRPMGARLPNRDRGDQDGLQGVSAACGGRGPWASRKCFFGVPDFRLCTLANGIREVCARSPHRSKTAPRTAAAHLRIKLKLWGVSCFLWLDIVWVWWCHCASRKSKLPAT